MIRMQAGTYELVEEFRDGWKPEAFKERYSDILDKYDYIVGDWGYGQLRLRGFYENSNRKVPFDQKIAALDEYLQEFCNFGCAYFVLRRVKANVPTDHLALHQDTPDVSDRPETGEDERPASTPERPPRHSRPPRPRQLERERQEADRVRSESGKERSERPDKQGRHRDRNGERPERGNKQERVSKDRRGRGSREKVSVPPSTQPPAPTEEQ